ESTVWVRAGQVPAHGAATVWAYFGTGALPAAPAKVWEGEYALVEHFGQGAEEGDTLADSTQRNEGQVVGGALTADTAGGEGRASVDGAAAVGRVVDGDARPGGTAVHADRLEREQGDILRGVGFVAYGGEPHASATQAGMPSSVCIAGEEVNSEMVEYRSTMG